MTVNFYGCGTIDSFKGTVMKHRVISILYVLTSAVMIYKGMVEGYTFDESYVQPLLIPGMDAPPPIPPKKRRQRKKPPPADQALSSTLGSIASQAQDTLSRRSADTRSISDDLYVISSLLTNMVLCASVWFIYTNPVSYAVYYVCLHVQ